ncbi:MAG TPA: phospholipase D-like domain-containing protein [Polyangiaceae bacterium]|nr:phospholipase D-like domain-containing protein [Polyangiaceae bacterium]
MVAEYLFSHALTLIALLASIVMVVQLLDSKRTPQSTYAWLLAIIFVPLVAIPLFLLLGRRKFPRNAKRPSGRLPLATTDDGGESPVARLLRKSGVAPARDGNRFELLTTGEVAFARLLWLIENAERSLDMTMFILADDAVGLRVVEALAARARSGIQVRLILDAVGSSGVLPHATRVLGAAGAEVRTFMPLRHSPVRGRTNLRSHRKLLIADGEHVFAGGMNVAGEYMGPPELKVAERWRDLAAVVSGPVAPDATALFESDWRYCHGNATTRVGSAPSSRGNEVLQLVPSGPDMVADTMYDALLTAVFAARERIVLITPYFVPDDALEHALVLAARRGVHADVVVPLRSNHRLADVARRASLRELSAAGVSLHYHPQMVHAKAMVIDELCAFIGSPNFDMRSLFLNYEDALFLYSPDAIAQVRDFADALRAECASERPHERSNWLLERVARLLAPEL